MNARGPAILSSVHLARKGDAVPTGYTPLRAQDVTAVASANKNADSVLPETSPLITSVAAPISAPAAFAGGDPPPPHGERARVSVRLDRDRHLKLKLAAAHLQGSLQDVITDALDQYLDQIGPEVLQGDCNCLSLPSAAAARDGQPDWSPERSR